MAIDVSKDIPAKMDSKQLLDNLKHIPAKQRNKILAGLTDKSATFSRDMVENANDLLKYLKDEGYNYEVVPRNDGSGLLARLRGVGGSDFAITVAYKDERRKSFKGEWYDRSGAYLVGNVVMNDRRFYVPEPRNKASREMMKNFNKHEMIAALTGRLEVKTEPSRSGGTADKRFSVLDENGNTRFKFFRARERDTVALLTEEDLEAYSYEEDEVMDDLVSDDAVEIQDPTAGMSPIEKLVYETNEMIRDTGEYNAEDYTYTITRSVNGFEETDKVYEMSLENAARNGLDLDTLIIFHDREVVAEVVNAEMRENPEFNLDSEFIIGTEGIKNLLMESTAGVRAEIVEPSALGDGYEAMLKHVESTLRNQQVEDIQVQIDSDHVIHWTGTQDGQDISGDIGQIFLPDKENQGVIRTAFNVTKDAEDRNYHMVPGYRAYYKSVPDVILDPRTVKTNFKGREVEVVANEAGEPFIMNNKLWLKESMMHDPEKVAEMVEEIERMKETDPDMKNISYRRRKSTLRDGLRFKGYDQSLSSTIEAVVARQVQQDMVLPNDNISLNKLYHGDVYGKRVNDHILKSKNKVETYKRRVRFENDVLQMEPQELGAKVKGYTDNGDPVYESTNHRHNLTAFAGILDPSLSTDGQALGLVGHMNSNVKVNKYGVPVVGDKSSMVYDRAPIYEDIRYTEADAEDRSLMAGNQHLRAKAVVRANVAHMTYKGYTFEDGVVVSKSFLDKFKKELGIDRDIKEGDDIESLLQAQREAEALGIDINDHPLMVGDKLTEGHGNKSTISYIGDPETDPFFKENPDLDVIMNPYSLATRFNAGTALEMQEMTDEFRPVTHNGETVAHYGQMDILVTDIAAKDKTKTYEHEYDEDGNIVEFSKRKGRSVSTQLAWIMSAMEMDGAMQEVYSKNTKAFDDLRNYLNVTGIDFDENGVLYKGTGFSKVNGEYGEDVPIVTPSENLVLPEEAGLMKLPVNVDLPSGASRDCITILPEKNRRSQELYDGKRKMHDYSRYYGRISQSALKIEDLKMSYAEANNVDLTTVDLTDKAQLEQFKQGLSEADRAEFNRAHDRLQGHVTGLTEHIIQDKLGGHMTEIERFKDGEKTVEYVKDGPAVKKSHVKTHITSHQTDYSATAVMTADPTIPPDTLGISPEIANKLQVKDGEMIASWRDPALYEGSLVGMKVEVIEDKGDNKLTGVKINPMSVSLLEGDFDGDTLGLKAFKTPEAKKELEENLYIGNRFLDPVTGEFRGSVSMDFVSAMKKAGYVGDNITKGPYVGREDDVKDMNAKKQLSKLLTDVYKEEDGFQKVSDLWMENVASENNIGAASVDMRSRETFRDSLLEITNDGAKGKPGAITSDLDEKYHDMPIDERKKKGLYPEQSTMMTYYDRGLQIQKARDVIKSGKGDTERAHSMLKDQFSPYVKEVDKVTSKARIVDNEHSYIHDSNSTRKAQAGKVDLTGPAGAASIYLVSTAFENPKYTMSAMNVTKQLSQASLQQKHDPSVTPKIESLLTDYKKMLREGGEPKERYVQKMKDLYEPIGLDAKDEDLENIHEMLSDKDGYTLKQGEAVNKNTSLLMRANMNGFDAFRDAADKNTKNIMMAVKTKNPEYLQDIESLKDGNMSRNFVPDRLSEVTKATSRVELAQKMIEHKDDVDKQAQKDGKSVVVDGVSKEAALAEQEAQRVEAKKQQVRMRIEREKKSKATRIAEQMMSAAKPTIEPEM